MKKRLQMCALASLIAIFVALYCANQTLIQPLSVPQEEILYEYPKGTSLKSLSKNLAQKGWISSPLIVEWYVRFSNSGKYLYAGEYLITKGMSAKDLIAKMRKGEVYMHALRIPEGGTWKEVVQLIHADLAIQKTSLLEDEGFRDVASEYTTGEGLLLPETYFFPKDETDLGILKRAYREMMTFAKQAFEARDLDVPFKDVYQTLIVASILEKEASIPEERAKIARVIINRLAKGMPLQMDPTIIYGMGDAFKGNLTKKNLQTPGPYNTYLNAGLPPTPICMPSKNAIVAAVHPAQGKYLYFVSKGDGSHYFSDTLQEHNRAVVKYIVRAKEKP